MIIIQFAGPLQQYFRERNQTSPSPYGDLALGLPEAHLVPSEAYASVYAVSQPKQSSAIRLVPPFPALGAGVVRVPPFMQREHACVDLPFIA